MTHPSMPQASPSIPIFSSMPSSFPEAYEKLLVGPVFRPWAQQLIDRTPLAPGARVLDVACGTGIVARLALPRVGAEGRVVGVDRGAPMLAVARTVEPRIDWREGDAAQLPLGDDETFDAVFCHQGLQFFPDKPAALSAMRRALVPGGRLAIGVWGSLRENSIFHDLGRIAEEFVGPIQDARHSFTDADLLARLVTEAGFSDVNVEPVTMEVHFENDPAILTRLNAMAVIGMSEKGKTMSEADRAQVAAQIVAASVPEITHYTTAGVTSFPMQANIATAVR
jgi:SAM-dependent methyltransferase